jgi:hypothetical protein
MVANYEVMFGEKPTEYSSPDGGECPAHKPIISSTDVAGLDIDPSELKLPRFSPDELVGKVFVQSPDDGKIYCAKVVRKFKIVMRTVTRALSFWLNLVMVNMMKSSHAISYVTPLKPKKTKKFILKNLDGHYHLLKVIKFQ